MSVSTSGVPTAAHSRQRPGEFADFYDQVGPKETYVILGAQGSGTNLLAKILRRAFGFSVVQDRSLIFNAAVAVNRNPSARIIRRQMRAVHRRLFPGPVFKRFLSRNYHHQARNYLGIESHFDSVPVRSASEFAAFFYTYHAWVNGCRHKAIKSDDIWQTLSHVDEILPERRYILLVRDPRDNALSITNKPWGPRHLYRAAHYVRKRLLIYRKEVEDNADRSIVVKYEDLLSRPTEFAEHFSEHFGIRMSDDGLQRLADLPIRAGNFNKWKRLDRADLAACESVLEDELREFQYERGTATGRAPGSLYRAKFYTQDICLRIPQKTRGMLNRILKP